jgi:cysteine-rich repeat protein
MPRVATIAVLAALLWSVSGATGPAHADPSAFPGVVTTVIAHPDDPAAIPDDGSLVSLLHVDLVGEVVDVDVTLGIEHESANHLDVFLVSPTGTTVTLTTDNGGGADDVFSDVTFDDQAPPRDPEEGETGPLPARHVRSVSYVDFEPLGTVQPEGALGAMVGDPAAGPWALVVVDDQGGQSGTLLGWALTLTTMTGVPNAAPPVDFEWRVPLDVPSGDADGLALPVEVSGLPARLLDVDVIVDVTHPRAQDLDFYLTAPSGRRVELATDLGGDFEDVYAHTTFDDDAPLPASDQEVDEEGGTPFVFDVVVPEGALGAFVGDDPNGDWTLTVVDDSGGNDGTLQRWALRVTTVAPCGNGVVDAGEECDDGNGGNGDGCDEDCRPSACGNGFVGIDADCDDGNTLDGDGCTRLCRHPEVGCDDCLDNDGNGLTDAADPNCGATVLQVKRAKVSKRGTVVVKAKTAPFDPQAGPVGLVLGDGAQTPLCTVLGPATPAGPKATVASGVLGGTLSVTLKSTGVAGVVIVKGQGLDLGTFDRKTVAVGLQIGSQRFGGQKSRGKGAKKPKP